MKYFSRIGAVAALISWASVAQAEPKWGFMGLGAGGCPDYAVNFEIPTNSKENLLGFFSWAQGYMSGLNNFLTPKRQLNGISEKAQKTELYKYCVAHPEKTFSASVKNLYDNLPELNP
ncbi:hypothetical protein QWJ07_10875 [Frankia sp. RB7]|nr:hypothetical protein [Frankia sp. RB7]